MFQNVTNSVRRPFHANVCRNRLEMSVAEVVREPQGSRTKSWESESQPTINGEIASAVETYLGGSVPVRNLFLELHFMEVSS